MSWITDGIEKEKLFPPRVPPTREEVCAGMISNIKCLLEFMSGPDAVKLAAVRNYINALWPAVVERYPELKCD